MKRHTDAERYKWLKYRGVKIKTYLAQWFISELFDSAVDELMCEWKQDPIAFNNKWCE